MNPLLVFLGTLPLLGAMLWGLVQNDRRLAALDKRIDEMRTNLEGRLDAFREMVNAKFEAHMQALLRVEGVLDARLRHLEEGRNR